MLTGRPAQVEQYYIICDDVNNAEALRRGTTYARHHTGTGADEGAGRDAVNRKCDG